MAGARVEPQDLKAFLEQTSEKLELCKVGLNVFSEVLAALQKDVDSESTTPPLSQKQCDTLHDLTTTMMTKLQNIRSSVTQLNQQCQSLVDLIHKVSMDLPTFLRDFNLQHLQDNFSEVTTVQQLLKLDNLEGDMTPVHRRRLEREIGKIRARVQSGAGLSEMPPTLHRLQETIIQITKLNESLSISTEGSGVTGWWISDTLSAFLPTTWQRSSHSEDTLTTRHRKIIEWIEQEQLAPLSKSGANNVTPDLTVFLLENDLKDLKTLSSFEGLIENIQSKLLNVNSSVDKWYKQAMEIADSL